MELANLNVGYKSIRFFFIPTYCVKFKFCPKFALKKLHIFVELSKSQIGVKLHNIKCEKN